MPPRPYPLRMDQSAIRAARRYEASIDRVGLALAAGAALSGLVILLLVLLGGQRDIAALATSWLIGGFFSAIASTSSRYCWNSLNAWL